VRGARPPKVPALHGNRPKAPCRLRLLDTSDLLAGTKWSASTSAPHLRQVAQRREFLELGLRRDTRLFANWPAGQLFRALGFLVGVPRMTALVSVRAGDFRHPSSCDRCARLQCAGQQLASRQATRTVTWDWRPSSSNMRVMPILRASTPDRGAGSANCVLPSSLKSQCQNALTTGRASNQRVDRFGVPGPTIREMRLGVRLRTARDFLFDVRRRFHGETLDTGRKAGIGPFTSRAGALPVVHDLFRRHVEARGDRKALSLIPDILFVPSSRPSTQKHLSPGRWPRQHRAPGRG